MKAMPLAEYLADPCPEPSLDSSTAWTLITRSPKNAWHQHPRLNPSRVADDADGKMDIGAAAHAILLENDQSRIVVVDAPDWRTKAAREARDEAHANGLTPLLTKHHAVVCLIVEQSQEAIKRCGELAGLFGDLSLPTCEQVCLWQDGRTWCRARPDVVSADNKVLLNYKTTATVANPDSFGDGMLVRSGYHVQAYHHARGIAAGLPTWELPTCVWLIQETEPPYAASILGASPSLMELAAAQWRFALARWRECTASGEWPAYPSRICWIEAKAWDLERWESRPDLLSPKLSAAGAGAPDATANAPAPAPPPAPDRAARVAELAQAIRMMPDNEDRASIFVKYMLSPGPDLERSIVNMPGDWIDELTLDVGLIESGI
jgi:hypothetical protein